MCAFRRATNARWLINGWITSGLEGDPLPGMPDDLGLHKSHGVWVLACERGLRMDS
jgi:hypothetical protein